MRDYSLNEITERFDLVADIWREEYMPYIDRHDKPALRESWNNFTDFLCKNGDITQEEYNDWGYPWECEG